jgi:hypothetical protein
MLSTSEPSTVHPASIQLQQRSLTEFYYYSAISFPVFQVAMFEKVPKEESF